ncbi:hypothetical protein SBDP1_1250018 [Syntrophobacter sp. SbD1]|nr:hypothetical protein SBDP1_1250018 [Syntrophobacter sp. SbD1]
MHANKSGRSSNKAQKLEGLSPPRHQPRKMHKSASQKREGHLDIYKSPGFLLGALIRIRAVNRPYYLLYTFFAKTKEKIRELICNQTLPGGWVLDLHGIVPSKVLMCQPAPAVQLIAGRNLMGRLRQC